LGNKRLIYAWQYFLLGMITSRTLANVCPTKFRRGRVERLKFNQFRSRERWFPLFATLFFFVLNWWKRKGSSQVKEGQERWIYFPPRLYRFLCARIRGHPSTHRSVIPRERGRNRQVGRYACILQYALSVAPYRIFDTSVPYPVDTACGKIFDRFKRFEEGNTFAIFTIYPFPSTDIASILREICSFVDITFLNISERFSGCRNSINFHIF